MKKTATTLRLVQIFTALGVLFLLYDAWQSLETAAWSAAFLKLGFAMSMLAITLSPSVVFGPVFSSLRSIEASPVEHRLSKRAEIPATIGALFLILSGVLWVLSRVPSN